MARHQPDDSLLTADESYRLEALKKRKDEVIERIKRLEANLADTQREIESIGIENLDVADDPKHAIQAFNKKPKDTVEKLISSGVFPPNDSKTIASYLWNTHGLSKKAIGDYLTGESEFEQLVLREFIFLQDIGQADVLTALRKFLNSFLMSGEGQIVDRVMMAFAECYCKVNEASKIFVHPDKCHIFLYAVMLLQTSLHNPNVKTGMKSTESVRLSTITSQQRQETVFGIRLKKDFSTNRAVITGRGKRRFFVLMEHCLFYFEDSDCACPRGIIPLESVRTRKVTDIVQHPHCMELYSITSESMTVCKIESGGNVPKSTHSNIRLAADSEEELRQWMLAIEQSSWMGEYQELIQLQSNRVQQK
ncbi:Sec7 domain protein [Aphelenchoides bicaudatus]|nr:Sec7 domain protein [Aphelenchoides bicaudatus]